MKNDLRLIQDNNSYFLKKILSKGEILKEDIYDGYLIDTNGDEKELRKIIDLLRKKNKIIAIIGGDNLFNRRVLETMPINYLISPEKGLKFDNLKQKDSGINHVLAKIAKQKNISIVIDFCDLKKLDDFDLSIRIARISQNLRVCQKIGTSIKIATFAEHKKDFCSTKELQEFMISIGASTKQAVDAVYFDFRKN